MLEILRYFIGNPSTLSGVPDPTWYEKTLFPAKLVDPYVLTSLRLFPLESNKSNNGVWFVSVFC